MPFPTDQQAIFTILGRPPRSLSPAGLRRLRLPVGLLAVSGVCWALMGVFFLGLGLLRYPHPVAYASLASKGAHAGATIVRCRQGKSASDKPEWKVDYAFADVRGLLHSGTVELSRAPGLRHGSYEPLDVLYSPSDPDVNRATGDSGDFWFFFGCGPVPLLFGLWQLRTWRCERNRRLSLLRSGVCVLGRVQSAHVVTHRYDKRLRVTVTYASQGARSGAWRLREQGPPADFSVQSVLVPGAPVAVLHDAKRPNVARVVSLTYFGLEPGDIISASGSS